MPDSFYPTCPFSPFTVRTMFPCVLAVFQSSKHVKVRLSDARPFCARYLEIYFFSLLYDNAGINFLCLSLNLFVYFERTGGKQSSYLPFRSSFPTTTFLSSYYVSRKQISLVYYFGRMGRPICWSFFSYFERTYLESREVRYSFRM
jgi:hypothetical protein